MPDFLGGLGGWPPNGNPWPMPTFGAPQAQPTGPLYNGRPVPRGSTVEVEDLLNQGRTESGRLAREEERRGQQAEWTLRESMQRANQPTLTNDYINLAMSQQGDAAGQQLIDRMAGLRDYLGAAGVTGGGMAAGMASDFELARMGQLTSARTGLMLEKAKTDALDRAAAHARTETLANVMMRPVAMQGMDWIGQETGFRQALIESENVREAALASAKAAKSKGKKDFLGGVIGSAIGAIGSLI